MAGKVQRSGDGARVRLEDRHLQFETARIRLLRSFLGILGSQQPGQGVIIILFRKPPL